MQPGAWEPLGAALLDYLDGVEEAALVVYVDDGTTDRIPAAHFFRILEELPDVERAALDLCHGRVLDVGAGGGAHALELQDQGLDVTALDISPLTGDVLRRRGVRNVEVCDAFLFAPQEPFDTLLLLMNGIGFVGTLDGLDRFLEHARSWLAPGGQMLLDSSDLKKSRSVTEHRAMAAREQAGRYRGQVGFVTEYNRRRSAPFDWLFVDAKTLRRHAEAAGWEMQVVFTDDATGDYLARLWPAT